jgi:hypothetical protein
LEDVADERGVLDRSHLLLHFPVAAYHEDRSMNTKACSGCPDGSVWNSNGPTSKTCPICRGQAIVNLDGSALTQQQIAEEDEQMEAEAAEEQSLDYFNHHIAGDR